MIKSITEHYRKNRIVGICHVSIDVVDDWVDNDNIPLWALRKLGYDICPKNFKFFTPSEKHRFDAGEWRPKND